MKHLTRLILIPFFALLVTTGFAQKEEIIVVSDKNLEVGDFDQYKTFTFAKHIQDDTDFTYFWESESMKDMLRTAIRGNLQALGYEYVEGAKADLVVNFQVFKEDTDLIGWENVETVTGYWGFSIDAQEREREDKTTYNVKKGTIMINMADLEEGVEVWRGFASGIVKDTDLSEVEEATISEAVNRILNEYDYTASR